MSKNYDRRVKKIWGIIEYKPRWTLTLRGWIVLLVSLMVSMVFFLSQIQPFLAFSAPIEADALVIEGWMGDGAVKGAIAEFNRGNYQIAISTGGDLSRGAYLAEYKNFAALSGATLMTLGFDKNKLVMLPTPNVETNRTVATAMTLHNWLSTAQLQIDSINLYSFDTHTRRSWLLFKQILEPEVKVGAIAYPSPDYDPKYWWTSSEGVRSVISETIAYVYAKFINWKT